MNRESNSQGGWWSRQKSKAEVSRRAFSKARKAEADPYLGSEDIGRSYHWPWIEQSFLGKDVATLAAAWTVAHVVGGYAKGAWRFLFAPIWAAWYLIACIQYLYRVQRFATTKGGKRSCREP